MCPIVPIFTCGLLRSNFFFAMMTPSLYGICSGRGFSSRGPGLNWCPPPYQGRALPTELQRHLLHTLRTHWWTGEDSNLRSSKERQVYSLLPLTARPPVRPKHPQCSPPSESHYGGTISIQGLSHSPQLWFTHTTWEWNL